MPYTWYDGASEGSFRFRINDGSVNGQESPEPAYTETKASILRRYFNTKARFDYIKPQIKKKFPILFKLTLFHFSKRRSTISKLRQDDDKQNSTFGSRRNLSRLSLMNSMNSLHYQREMLGRGFGRARRHWSLSDIPRSRVEMISEQKLSNSTLDDQFGSSLARR